MRNNRNRVEKELASVILSAMETFDLEELELCPLDALQLLNRTRIKTDLTQLRHILKKDWKLINQKNTMVYRKFMIWPEGVMGWIDGKGRYYTIKKDFLLEQFGEE